MRTPRSFQFAVTLGLAAALSACGSSAKPMTAEQVALETGKAVFTTCAGCHGNDAQGRDYMYAPNLTGLSGDYIKRQLMNFRTGKRGKIEDPHGFPMVGRATAIGDEANVDAVVSYIQTLPVKPMASVEGKAIPADLEDEIATCATCHGADGKGNPDMRAPALTGLDAPYIAKQLHKFRNGLRGYDAADSEGQTMAASAKAIANDGMIDALANYYGTRPDEK